MTPKKRTITLTDRPPVLIVEADWPVIAQADWHDGKVECQANHIRTLRIRKHADWRILVYGIYGAGPGGVHADFRGAHAGFLIEAVLDNYNRRTMNTAGVVAAIRDVAASIGDPALGDECLANMPAEVLA